MELGTPEVALKIKQKEEDANNYMNKNYRTWYSVGEIRRRGFREHYSFNLRDRKYL